MYYKHRKPARIRLGAVQNRTKPNGPGAADSNGSGTAAPKEKDNKPVSEKKDAKSAQGDEYKEMSQAKKGSLFGRFNAAFQDALQTNRGDEAVEASSTPAEVTADDLAIRRAKNVTSPKMIVPEGVIISGSLTSGSETEIAGRIEGDVTVEGRLHLGATALISGNVRATWCRIDGLVEGKVDSSQELVLGASGRVNGNILGGKEVQLAGQVIGDISSSGLVSLGQTSKLKGDIRARRLIIQEGAVFNGDCEMRTPVQRDADS